MLSIVLASVFAVQLASMPDATCKGEGEGNYRVIDVKNSDARVVVFGDRHSTDPADPFFHEVERLVTELSPTVIVVEGQPGGPKPESRTVAIQHGGAGGLACWLASRSSVPCVYADLTEDEEARRLLKKYQADEVLVYFVVRVLAYFNPRPAAERPPGDLVEFALRRAAPLVGKPTASQEDLAMMWRRVLHRRFDPKEVTTDWHHPFKKEMITQRISREDNALREPYMIEQLIGAATPGARVFAVYGEGHVCSMRRRLRDGLQKNAKH